MLLFFKLLKPDFEVRKFIVMNNNKTLWHLSTGVPILKRASTMEIRQCIKILRKQLCRHTTTFSSYSVALLTLLLIKLMFSHYLKVLDRQTAKSQIEKNARWMTGAIKNLMELTTSTFLPWKLYRKLSFSIITLSFHFDAILFSQHSPSCVRTTITPPSEEEQCWGAGKKALLSVGSSLREACFLTVLIARSHFHKLKHHNLTSNSESPDRSKSCCMWKGSLSLVCPVPGVYIPWCDALADGQISGWVRRYPAYLGGMRRLLSGLSGLTFCNYNEQSKEAFSARCSVLLLPLQSSQLTPPHPRGQHIYNTLAQNIFAWSTWLKLF